jgi:hypothetical protein
VVPMNYLRRGQPTATGGAGDVGTGTGFANSGMGGMTGVASLVGNDTIPSFTMSPFGTRDSDMGAMERAQQAALFVTSSTAGDSGSTDGGAIAFAVGDSLLEGSSASATRGADTGVHPLTTIPEPAEGIGGDGGLPAPTEPPNVLASARTAIAAARQARKLRHTAAVAESTV